MSYLIHSKCHQAIYLLAGTSSMGHAATFYRMSRKTLPSCHLPSCPTLSSDDDVSWWLGWVRMLMVTCSLQSLQCDLTWLPVTRVCLATEGEQLSVGWWNVWPLSPAAAMGTGHTRGWGDLRRIADTVTSMQPGTSGHTQTTHPYFDIW